MQQRQLGTLKVSALGLGCMGMSGMYGSPAEWAASEGDSLRTLDTALERGVTLYDTADVYGPHTNEALLGRWLAGKRGRVVLATKFGFRSAGPGGGDGVNGHPAYVMQAAQASLKRLHTEVIDLYYLHRLDPQVPIEDTVGAMGELVQQGLVRHLGLSEVSPATLRRAHAVHPISAVQSEYSLWTRDPEEAVGQESLLATCRALGVGFVPFSPLGRGFLTGQLQSPADFEEGDYRRGSPRFQGENFERNLALVRQVQALAQGKGCTPAQLALGWVLAQGNDLVPIPGTKRVPYLLDNLGALDVTLTPDDLSSLDAIFAVGPAGERYQPGGARLIDRSE